MRHHIVEGNRRAEDERVVRMLHMAIEPLHGEAAHHGICPLVDDVAAGNLGHARAHTVEVQVEERHLHAIEHGAAAEFRDTRRRPCRFVIELDEHRTRRRPGRRPFAHLDNAVCDIGRKRPLLYLHDDHALLGVCRIGDEAHIERRGGRNVAAAQLADDLAVICR